VTFVSEKRIKNTKLKGIAIAKTYYVIPLCCPWCKRLKVVALWSGGKESCLACQKAMAGGFDVDFIVTFLWETPFVCHPLSLMPLQSKALGIPQVKAKVKEPYFEEYREAISRFIKEDGIKGIVTGDISFIDNFHGNWIDDFCKGLDVEVIKPLWGLDRCQILKELVSKGFKAVFTCVRKRWFDEKWLGRELDRACIKELKELNDKQGIDLCGERGEYHTMIVDAPIFKEVIQISKFSKEKKGGLFFIKPTQFFLGPKQGRAHNRVTVSLDR
jgi:diphthine-ammonia ligase